MTLRKRIDKTLELVLIGLTSILVIDVLWQVISRYLNKFLVNKMNIHIPVPIPILTLNHLYMLHYVTLALSN